MDRAGVPFVMVSLALTGVAGVFLGAAWAAPFAFLTVAFGLFFRDPARRPPPATDGKVLSPADGRVMVSGDAEPAVAPSGDWKQISIFLSPLDVHVNRVPVSGEVLRIDERHGRFLPAYRPEAAAANERTEIWVRSAGRVVVFRQVVGVLARRIVCRLRPGQQVVAGERFGIMKFGSRMDVFLPLDATLRVQVGDRVRGGESILASFGTREMPA